ncbi:MAG: triose-phosphate isomerase [Bacilli bacterium]
MKILIGNHKMNLTKDETINYINSIKNIANQNMIIAPSNIYLSDFTLENILTCSPDVSAHDKGAFTGEVSANQLHSINVNYSLVGHSERRINFNEKPSLLKQKINQCFNNNIIPILCVGETLEEKNTNKFTIMLKKEFDIIFNEFNNKTIIIAYEPVWSIGSGFIPTMDEIKNIHNFIKDYFYKNFNYDVKVVYGGSVNENNTREILSINSVDGLLVGEVSLKVEKFLEIFKEVNKYNDK